MVEGEISREELIERMQGGRVWCHLKKNKHKGFTVKRIATLLKMKTSDVDNELRKLKRGSKVFHDSPYWACKRKD